MIPGLQVVPRLSSRVHTPCPRDAWSVLSFERGHLREETECSSVIEGLLSCDVPLKQPVQTLETGPGNLTGKQGFLSLESWWKVEVWKMNNGNLGNIRDLSSKLNNVQHGNQGTELKSSM